MDPLHATIEEFAAEGYTHIECFRPHCRMIRLRPMSWLPKIWMGLTLDQLAQRLRCAKCSEPLLSVKSFFAAFLELDLSYFVVSQWTRAVRTSVCYGFGG